jgi:hypothetical protein
MAERLIGSLVYGDHPEPKQARPWKERFKFPVTIGLILIVGGGLLYKFINYPEESRVQSFLDAVGEGRFDDAYAMWDGGEAYDIGRFLEDWGSDAYYTTGSTLEVVDSEGSGGSVIVYVSVHAEDDRPTALRVDKETRLLSYSPTSKYINTAIYGPPN